EEEEDAFDKQADPEIDANEIKQKVETGVNPFIALADIHEAFPAGPRASGKKRTPDDARSDSLWFEGK
ncbi:MAG TPA: hypothetical protein VHH73_17235, partial [Verrucomicrobiae bacterium]|nr:hypothetical protein [Verrucomicrobiae bacterium]